MFADSLQLAFDRVEDFLAVQRPLSLPPLLRLQEAAGIDARERTVVRERLSELGQDEAGGGVLLGLLVGLFAAQFEDEA